MRFLRACASISCCVLLVQLRQLVGFAKSNKASQYLLIDLALVFFLIPGLGSQLPIVTLSPLKPVLGDLIMYR